VNELPLGVMECKSPFVTDPMAEGINQLLRYANLRHPGDLEGCEKLFHCNQVMASTHRNGARVGTISSPVEDYLERTRTSGLLASTTRIGSSFWQTRHTARSTEPWAVLSTLLCPMPPRSPSQGHP